MSISHSSAEYITSEFSVLLQLQAYAGYKLVQWQISDRVGPINLGRGEEHPFLGRRCLSQNATARRWGLRSSAEKYGILYLILSLQKQMVQVKPAEWGRILFD